LYFSEFTQATNAYSTNDSISRFTCLAFGATENARPENAGLENDGQLRKELQGLENARLENDGQHF